jgi:hypothetical protein
MLFTVTIPDSIFFLIDLVCVPSRELLVKDLSHPFRRFFHPLASVELLLLDLD